MLIGWTIAKFLFKVMAPSIPEVISTVASLRKQHQNPDQQEALEARLVEAEKAVDTQLQLIQQFTHQLQTLEKTLSIALTMAVLGLVLAVVALGVLLLQ